MLVESLTSIIELNKLLASNSLNGPDKSESRDDYGEMMNSVYPMSIREMEKLLICRTLDETGGNKSKAARVLGISRQTLREKTKLYDSDEDDIQVRGG